MPLIEWKESYAVGIDLIDADHKLLVSLINQVHEAREDGQSSEMMGSVLNVLIEYTLTHFAREELLMEKGKYPDFEAHKKEHVKLTDKVSSIVDRYNGGDATVVDDELIEFLKTWLTGHIIAVDMKYKPFVEGITLSPEELLRSFSLEVT